jgi:hypothetical protein
MSSSDLLTRFLSNGTSDDLNSLIPLVMAWESKKTKLDVSVSVALQLCERCVHILEIERLRLSLGWECIAIFLIDDIYPHAEEFARTFLPSAIGRRAFQCSKHSLAAYDNSSMAMLVCGHVLQFLSNALWFSAQAVHMLRVECDTYRVAFAFITSNGSDLPRPARSLVILMFQHTACGRSTDAIGTAAGDNGVLCEAVERSVICGSLPALSAVFWAISTDPDVHPNDFIRLRNAFKMFVWRLLREEYILPVEPLIAHWCTVETTNPTGIIAGSYALFEALLVSPMPAIRARYSGFSTSASHFIALLRLVLLPTTIVEQAIKFPYKGADTIYPEGTWLYKCLQATRKAGEAAVLGPIARNLSSLVQDIPWAKKIIASFFEQATAKRENKPERKCAFPGCDVTSSAACPLLKCGRCMSVYYCSGHHQHAHWSAHKKECVKAASEAPESAAGSSARRRADECALPGCEAVNTVQHPLLRCSRCRSVRYCCEIHQREHWAEHKPKCVKATPAADAAPPPPPSTNAATDASAANP